ncbi:MAG: alpha/beta hydrolase [Verrucomicrobiota bacterium]
MKHLSLWKAVMGIWLLTTLAVFAQQKSKKVAMVPDGVRVIRDLEYSRPDSGALLLDLYLPEKKSKRPLPVVIWVHGGGWKAGSKNRTPAAYLAQHGFAVASINYRLLDVAQWPSQINDCYASVRWLRSQADRYHLDAGHIGVWGGSAGGHLVALMGTRLYPDKEKISSRVQAVCDWYGPSELLTMPPNTVGDGRSEADVAKSNGARLLGQTVYKVPQLAKDASALDQVSAQSAPFLIMHGSEDPGVPIEQSQKLHAALEKAGVESTFHIVKGAGHGGKLFRSEAVEKMVLDFFNQQLKR